MKETEKILETRHPSPWVGTPAESLGAMNGFFPQRVVVVVVLAGGVRVGSVVLDVREPRERALREVSSS